MNKKFNGKFKTKRIKLCHSYLITDSFYLKFSFKKLMQVRILMRRFYLALSQMPKTDQIWYLFYLYQYCTWERKFRLSSNYNFPSKTVTN